MDNLPIDLEESFNLLFLDAIVELVAVLECMVGCEFGLLVLVKGCGPFWGGGCCLVELLVGCGDCFISCGDPFLERSREVLCGSGVSWRLLNVLEQLAL